MEYVGLDVHKNQSQICLITEAREVLHQRIHTQWERLAAFLLSARRPASASRRPPKVNGWPNAWRHWATRSSWLTPTTRRCTPNAVAASRPTAGMPRPWPDLSAGRIPPGASDVGAPAACASGAHRARGLGAEPDTVEQCGASAAETTRLSPAQWSNGVLSEPGSRTRAVGGSPGRD
jgi:hypothetical protein